MKLRHTQILQKINETEDRRGIKPIDLSDNIGLDNSTITYHLRKLENKSLVTSISVGRNKWYDLTEKGVQALEEGFNEEAVKIECGNCSEKHISIEKAKSCCTDRRETE